MKKVIKESILITLLYTKIIYLMFAFVLLELNPIVWSEASRYFYVVFGGVFGIILGVAYYMQSIINRDE